MFARDCVFASPSAAASVVAGRPANGRIEWVERTTQLSYANWQARQVDAVFAPDELLDETAVLG